MRSLENSTLRVTLIFVILDSSFHSLCWLTHTWLSIDSTRSWPPMPKLTSMSHCLLMVVNCDASMSCVILALGHNMGEVFQGVANNRLLISEIQRSYRECERKHVHQVQGRQSEAPELIYFVAIFWWNTGKNDRRATPHDLPWKYCWRGQLWLWWLV